MKGARHAIVKSETGNFIFSYNGGISEGVSNWAEGSDHNQ